MTRILVAFCLVLTVVGCGSPTDAEDGISFHVALSASVLAPGDTVSVTVTVVNVRAEPVTIEGNHCNMHFEVRDSRGILFVPAEAIFCPGVHIPVVLGQGASHTFGGSWSGRLSDPAGNQHQATPGTYRIRGRAILVNASRTASGGFVPIAVSAPSVP